MDKLICSNCKEETEIGWEDIGVGGTYKGDSYSFDSRVIPVSMCCGEDILIRSDDTDVEDKVLTKMEAKRRDPGWNR